MSTNGTFINQGPGDESSPTTSGGTQNTVIEEKTAPSEDLGFEISPRTKHWTFTPKFYPGDLTQVKKKELSRYGGNCGAESVSIKSIKNREFHIEGKILQGEIPLFQSLIDLDHEVDLISPLTPVGGMECWVKRGEIKNQAGWDPHARQWMFEYTLDLVSTGRDEHDSSNRNAIVTPIMQDNNEEALKSLADQIDNFFENNEFL